MYNIVHALNLYMWGCVYNIHVMWVREDGKNMDLGQASRSDHVSGAIWRSKTLDVGRSREKRWIRGLPIFSNFLTPHVGLLRLFEYY